MPDASSPVCVLVTGATGYIGGRLVPRLLEEGLRVRLLVREPRKLLARTWVDRPNLEVRVGDAADCAALRSALSGCSAAYYLIHSMIVAGADYGERDRELGRIFAAATADAGVERIIYLGGLGETGEGLSRHLASRRETEEALRAGPVPVTTLRAAMIIGSGSASFEILRYLVERLPVMITPRWVNTECQPIAVENVLHYLVECLNHPQTRGRILDIGGANVLTYREIMSTMAELRGLPKRIIIPVPVLTPNLSSLWIHLVTPVSSRIARPLAEGLRNRVVCRDDEVLRMMPQRLLTVREAIQAALAGETANEIESSWKDAGPIPGDPDFSGGTTYVDRRETTISAPASDVFRTLCRLGGENGYYSSRWLWRLRGWLDILFGGPGLRRGRRDPQSVRFGDALDFWRVTAVDPDRRLRLQAEMKLPGEAILEFEIFPVGASSRGGLRSAMENREVRLMQTALFKPRGLAGILYWYSVMPLHSIVFRGMLRGIERAALRNNREPSTGKRQSEQSCD